MALDDRDYMRERHRDDADRVHWNDRKGRVERGGVWFEEKNRGFDYQNRFSRPRVTIRQHPARNWICLLSAVSILLPAYRELKRAGWLPDWEAAAPFPSSGSVTVNRTIDPRSATSRLRVVTAGANAVVQLYDASTDVHIISLYVRRDDDVSVPVPPGTYSIKIVEGDKWHGRTRYFGSITTAESVVATMTFGRNLTHSIDLHRRPDGNLHTRPDLFNPKPLR